MSNFSAYDDVRHKGVRALKISRVPLLPLLSFPCLVSVRPHPLPTLGAL